MAIEQDAEERTVTIWTTARQGARTAEEIISNAAVMTVQFVVSAADAGQSDLGLAVARKSLGKLKAGLQRGGF